MKEYDASNEFDVGWFCELIAEELSLAEQMELQEELAEENEREMWIEVEDGRDEDGLTYDEAMAFAESWEAYGKLHGYYPCGTPCR